ncbi:universal stress protein [Desulfuromonas acetoxidans]|uniref:universal stress protein n=1 Tax=Desulfuromonas acetoxidans TaxID=891 RepID=UPI00292CD0A0|nr:universal stress protein [Desulfuromonas acetoxidans]
MSFKILVPICDGVTSKATVQALIDHKDQFNTPITLLHVVNLDKMDYRMIPDFQIDMVRQYATKTGEKFLAEQTTVLQNAGLEIIARMETGSPRDTICRIANEENFSLVIIGRHSSGEIRDVLFGSVSNHVLHGVKCPVLLF